MSSWLEFSEDSGFIVYLVTQETTWQGVGKLKHYLLWESLSHKVITRIWPDSGQELESLESFPEGLLPSTRTWEPMSKPPTHPSHFSILEPGLEPSLLTPATAIRCHFQANKSSGWNSTTYQKICSLKFILNNLALSKGYDYISVNCQVGSSHLECLQSFSISSLAK